MTLEKPAPRRPRAFTFIEAVVVMAIIMVLVALLLPAIQQAREAARRAACQANLEQLGVALWNYADTVGCLPPGAVDPASRIGAGPGGYRMSWIAQILPYYDQRPLHDAINFDQSSFAAANITARTTAIASLLCPSQPAPRPEVLEFARRFVLSGGMEDMTDVADVPEGAPSSYAGCHHYLLRPIGEEDPGTLFLNSAIRPRDVPDGLSLTLLVAERRPMFREDWGWLVGSRSTLRNTGTGINLAYANRSLPGMPEPDDPEEEARSGFGSTHPGGVSVLFGDGSVRFLSESVSPEVLFMLGHRADGQILSSDWY